MLETSVLPADVRARVDVDWESFWTCRQALAVARQSNEQAAAAHLLNAARAARDAVTRSCEQHLDVIRGLIVVRVSDFAYSHGIGGLVLAARKDAIVVPAVVRPGALDNGQPLMRTRAGKIAEDIPPAFLAAIAWSAGARKETVIVTSNGVRGIA